MKPKRIKVAAVQATPALFDIAKTTDIIISWIEKAAKEKCELILFPESFIPCYPRGLNFDAVVGRRTEKSRETWLHYWENSFEEGSIHHKKISETIKKANVFVALGVTERDNIGGSLYCTLLYFNNEGGLAGKHRKIKPTGLERYIWGESDGSGLVSFDGRLGKIGGLICWENYMPLARMAMYEKGVEIYLAPTADARPSWQATMQHIALEGRCFVMACNQFVRKSDYPGQYLDDVKNEPDIICPGGTVIISPLGETLAGPLWNEEGMLIAEIDFSLLAKAKLDFDVTGHYSRKDIFKFSVINQPGLLKIG
ncbi:MAG TPA: carbon-nitrogen hydrolase family protein [Puia sp.]|nr:carbon-nitrogen hydrolase family protein [Puia sp.]